MHPRAGHTILQPHRHSASPHPYLSTSPVDLAELGMPKLWSAVAPAASKPVIKPVTASDVVKGQDAAGIAVAQEVLKAGQVYSAAVAKLQATLTGSGVASQPQPALQQGDPSAALRHDPRLEDGINARPEKTAADAVAGATVSVDPTMAATASHGPYNGTNQGAQHGAAAFATKAPAHAKIARHADDRTFDSAVLHSSQQAADANGVTPHSDADDSYISLHHHAKVVDGNVTVVDRSAIKTEVPLKIQNSTAVKSIYSAGAESSDSQGSLPEIDSGESSDSADSQ